MKIIVITVPEKRANEGQMIEKLFAEGMDILHLRKPEMPLAEFEGCLKAISPHYYKRIVIHSHYKLIEKYNLKGIHLTELYRKEIDNLEDLAKFVHAKGLSISTSVHSIEEISGLDTSYDYAFISPVFNSISKQEYKGKIDLAMLKKTIRDKVSKADIIALGGINESNLAEIKETGVNGIALLGAVWNARDPAVAFANIKNRVEK